MRQDGPFERRMIPEDISELEYEIGSMTEQGRPWVFWDVQNPWWMNAVVIVSAVVLVVSALASEMELWLSVVTLLLALGLLTLYGGLHTSVASDKVEVKAGMLGMRLLRVRIADIAEADLKAFSPLREYGGYGIRYNPRLRTWAFFFRGNRGVLLKMNNGKNYLIGSDTPERLASTIRVAMRYAG